ncbi:MAG: hypothetical protein WBL43_13500, partial [Pseudolabrys sp.]
IDSEGKVVIITPRSESGVLEPLAIPIFAQLPALCAASLGNCTGASSKDQAAFSSGQQVQNPL